MGKQQQKKTKKNKKNKKKNKPRTRSNPQMKKLEKPEFDQKSACVNVFVTWTIRGEDETDAGYGVHVDRRDEMRERESWTHARGGATADPHTTSERLVLLRLEHWP